jgi:hypothetical protein
MALNSGKSWPKIATGTKVRFGSLPVAECITGPGTAYFHKRLVKSILFE